MGDICIGLAFREYWCAKSTSIILGVTLAGVICATYLITRPREKRQRVLAIGVFGALALTASRSTMLFPRVCLD